MNNNFTIISAVSVDGFIGIDNNIPWHIPEDFKHFRETTMGNVVVVGYNTYLTLPIKALEGREYIVLNAGNYFRPEYERPNVKQFSRLDVFLRHVDYNSHLFKDKKIFVAGGAMVYDTLFEYCNEAIITWVNKHCPDGNKRFPIDKLDMDFMAVENQDSTWLKSRNDIEYKIINYIRKS